MKRMWLTMGVLPAFLGLLSGLAPCSSQQARELASAPEAPGREQIDRWIAELADASFDVREAATERLKKRVEAAPAVRNALQSPDVEVRQRARDILEAFDRRRAPKELDKAGALAKDGRCDELAELVVRWQRRDEDKRGWQAVYELARKAVELADADYSLASLPKGRPFPTSDFRAFMSAVRPVDAPPDSPTSTNGHRFVEGHYLIEGDEIDVKAGIACSLVVASRSVRLRGPFNGVIVCGGNVAADELTGSVVICDGDFTARNSISDSLVIARASTRYYGMADGVFLSSGEIGFRAGSSLHGTARTGVACPLHFIKFFDPAEAGVDATAVDGRRRVPDGVLVKSVAKDKPFAAAGLQEGDVITAVAGEKNSEGVGTDDQLDSFRRPLRKALAAGEEFTLTVRRGDKTIDLTVRPADK